MMILLDGFDEVPKLQRPLLSRWLNTQMRNYPKSVFVLSSRSKAYSEQPFNDDRLDLKSVFNVQRFELKQIQEFVAILIMTFDLLKPSKFERRHRLFKDRYCNYSQ